MQKSSLRDDNDSKIKKTNVKYRECLCLMVESLLLLHPFIAVIDCNDSFFHACLEEIERLKLFPSKNVLDVHLGRLHQGN
mmetsp:Transcript_28870/g.44377  ORF Transcript_28870/g.44377 Transcript_28870/m.44377 type:complete len:80 (-) Transcript_28870:621-860(-)